MTMDVAAWQQAGHLYVWRYAILNRSRRGWHFHADRVGCESVADLIDRMVAGGEPSHRTLVLGSVTPETWALPNFGPPKGDRFARLRIEYWPGQETLGIEPVEDRLVLGLGAKRAPFLRAALIDLSIGQNDFGIAPSDDRHGDPWMFW
ncbi:hypothetical protein [Sphingomonas psychrotolerans]|uniref:Uncharacterized protein n=1 Tax=Sphingomonas psychrotolerans TaxID=1327635 RepID=A0A2K8MIJ8_9SPHN|nr:hypothetical protein [Sphingomonas psychrotolerans]ATY32824.1 hypothetical protein CVN68_13270 [Sphingomonas psychrotolerans]